MLLSKIDPHLAATVKNQEARKCLQENFYEEDMDALVT